jgi:hypothetical protein
VIDLSDEEQLVAARTNDHPHLLYDACDLNPGQLISISVSEIRVNSWHQACSVIHRRAGPQVRHAGGRP